MNPMHAAAQKGRYDQRNDPDGDAQPADVLKDAAVGGKRRCAVDRSTPLARHAHLLGND